MQEANGQVLVEFYGVPALRAGRDRLGIDAGTVAEAIRQIEQACPALIPLAGVDGRLNPHYLVSLNARGFVSSLDHVVCEGDRLLVMSADAGG